MRLLQLIPAAALAVVLAIQPSAPQAADADSSRWTSEQQVHRENGTATKPRPTAGPEQQLERFFQALNDDEPNQAAQLIAQQPLQISEAELLKELQQWTHSVAKQEFEILGSYHQGDFALVRARFMPPEQSVAETTIRPVILFREQGDWKVVWELIGMQPQQAARVDPQVAERLQPLYAWYTQQQRVQTGHPGESPGGTPASDEALSRKAESDQAPKS